MKDGFIKVATATPKVTVADVDANVKEIIALMEKASEAEVMVTVFPELCITGYSCGELFFQKSLIDAALEGLEKIKKATENLKGMFFVGLPILHNGKLYNAAAAVTDGWIAGIVPKTYLPNYGEFYEQRYFAPGIAHEDPDNDGLVFLANSYLAVSSQMIFQAEEIPNLQIGVEICEDLWVPNPPSVRMAMNGATIIVNLSASDAITGKAQYRKNLVVSQSAKLHCAYLYASAGSGESTQDVVYSGQSIIAENGHLLAESPMFYEGLTITEVDVDRLVAERARMNTFGQQQKFYWHAKRYNAFSEYEEVDEDEDGPICISTEQRFHKVEQETVLTRKVNPMPFVPSNPATRKQRCEEIFEIQARGLVKRLEHTHCKTAVIGISGGLDSTLALLVTARAYDILGMDRKNILAVTMPGFGTTDRTYDNAVSMVRSMGATLKEVSIVKAVRQHFADIGQDEAVHDVTYENCQARERTQILMDLANKENGMVIGTGDMSELALGWATYNGDHMSMYGVNVSIPKTLVRHLVSYYADCLADEKLKSVLLDVLDTPVSPELLPPEDGKISQKTEDIVGPYELHDFVLYYVLRFGFRPRKIYRLARIAFAGTYDNETILKWMKTFYRRFFSQQFKRSCLPDGPKVGTVAVSPRGDLRMPSDASASLWLKEVESLEA
ncbi:MAG: NAD(+) synthase [Lachnospiraceae bacterium]|jgi:NAD+ synthase (glutamine-hydrolysing)|nr:NAD(+) synthase [Lachnospiraceae bacterium]